MQAIEEDELKTKKERMRDKFERQKVKIDKAKE